MRYKLTKVLKTIRFLKTKTACEDVSDGLQHGHEFHTILVLPFNGIPVEVEICLWPWAMASSDGLCNTLDITSDVIFTKSKLGLFLQR